MEPCPPERLVPPITAAAIASSSMPSEPVGCPMRMRAACTTPAKPNSSPASTKYSTTQLSTGIPERRALSELLPMAKQ